MIWINAPVVPISIDATEVVTPVVNAVPLLCVPSDVSENLNWWCAVESTL